MPLMRRTAAAILATAALCLALPAGAPATLAEVGVLPPTTPPTVPSCPTTPCLAVSRTTGFQVKVGAAHNFLAVPRSGTIVAWTITLGKPNASQIKFFNSNEGGTSEAGIGPRTRNSWNHAPVEVTSNPGTAAMRSSASWARW